MQSLPLPTFLLKDGTPTNNPFSGYRRKVYAAVSSSVGRFVSVPPAEGRGFDPVKAGQKINLALEDLSSPFEFRYAGPRKAPVAVGLFVVGTQSDGTAPRDPNSGRKRTAYRTPTEGVGGFGNVIRPSLPVRAETYGARVEGRKAAAEGARETYRAAILEAAGFAAGEAVPEGIEAAADAAAESLAAGESAAEGLAKIEAAIDDAAAADEKLEGEKPSLPLEVVSRRERRRRAQAAKAGK
jgi:hypothetical protein